jgi:sugar lactone lactonase YvrE
VVVLAQNLPGPDDLLLASDGSIYMSDVGDGTVKRYTTDGRVQVILTNLREPEGIIVLPDGSLVIAEQVPNRLLHYDPALKVLTPLLNLENTTNLEGVDGISLDARARDKLSIVIADSRNGRVLRASLDGKTVTELGRGFVRPTAVWIEADGSILVVDEEGNTLKRIRPDGKIEKLADLPVPDDVIEDDAGHIFVNTLRDNAIHMISAATNQDSILVRGLALPQGIIFDADGNLVVSDPGHHRLIKIVIRP